MQYLKWQEPAVQLITGADKIFNFVILDSIVRPMWHYLPIKSDRLVIPYQVKHERAFGGNLEGLWAIQGVQRAILNLIISKVPMKI